MKNRSFSEISESEESEEEQNSRKPSTSENVKRNNEDFSSNSSSESEEPTKPPSPPVDSRKRKSSTSTSPKKNVSFNPLERYISENNNLKKVDVNDVVTEDDDVCLLEVPKSINPMEFLEKVVNFDRKTKIKLNKTKYVIESEVEDIKPINLLTRKLKVINPISVLRMRQYSKPKQESEAVVEATTPPALPDSLKVRHPLFGSEFKRKIVLDEEIERKLNLTIDKVMKKVKKKKHKRDSSQEFVAPVEPTDSRQKKKHKKQMNEGEIEENVDESIFAMLETHVAKRNKKDKADKEMWRMSSSDSGIFADVKTEREHGRERKKSVRETEDAGDEYVHTNKYVENARNQAEESANIDNEHKSSKKDSEHEPKRKRSKSMREAEEDDEHNYKKKHKNKEGDVREYQTKNEEMEETKRKRNNSHKEGRNSQGESSFCNSWEGKKKGHSNIKQELTDVSDYENNSKSEKKKKQKIMNESLHSFEDSTSKKKKKYLDVKQEQESDESLEHSHRKNRSKADKSMSEQEENYGRTTSSPEKKKRLSFINSTVIPGVELPFFDDFDVSRIVNKEEQGVNSSSKNGEESPEEQRSHKDRRKKEASFESDVRKNEKQIKKERVEEIEPEAVSPRKRKKKAESEDEGSSSPTKKRKQIKEEDGDDVLTNSLISNLLKKVKSEMGTSTNHKKKK